MEIPTTAQPAMLNEFLSPGAIELEPAGAASSPQYRPQTPQMDLARVLLIDESMTAPRREAIARELAANGAIGTATRAELVALLQPQPELDVASAAVGLPVAAKENVVRWLLRDPSAAPGATAVAATIERGSLTDRETSQLAAMPARRFNSTQSRQLLSSLAVGAGLSEDARGEMAVAVGFTRDQVAAQLNSAGSGDGADSNDDQPSQGGRSSAEPRRGVGGVTRIGAASGPADNATAVRQAPEPPAATLNQSETSPPSDNPMPATFEQSFKRSSVAAIRSQRSLSDRLTIMAGRETISEDSLASDAERSGVLARRATSELNSQLESGPFQLAAGMGELGRSIAEVRPGDQSLQPGFAAVSQAVQETSVSLKRLALAGGNPPLLRFEEVADNALNVADVTGRLAQAGQRLTGAEQAMLDQLLTFTERLSAEAVSAHLLAENVAGDLATSSRQLSQRAETTLARAPQNVKTTAARTQATAAQLAARYERLARTLPAESAGAARRVAEELDSLAELAGALAAQQTDITAAAVQTLAGQLGRVVEACVLLAPQLSPKLRAVEQQTILVLRAAGSAAQTDPQRAVVAVALAASRTLTNIKNKGAAIDGPLSEIGFLLDQIARDLAASPMRLGEKGARLREQLAGELNAVSSLVRNAARGVGGVTAGLKAKLARIAAHCEELSALVNAAVQPQLRFLRAAVNHLAATISATPAIAAQTKELAAGKAGMALRIASGKLAVAAALVQQAAKLPAGIRLRRATNALRSLSRALHQHPGDIKRQLARHVFALAVELKQTKADLLRGGLLAKKARLVAKVAATKAGLLKDVHLSVRELAQLRAGQQQLALNVRLEVRAFARHLGVDATQLVNLRVKLAKGEQLDRPSLLLLARVSAAEKSVGVAQSLRGVVHESIARRNGHEPLTGALLTRRPPPPLRAPHQQIQSLARDGMVWTPGYWTWNGQGERFTWVRGALRKPPVGKVWLPGRWAQTPAGFRRVAGAWINPGRIRRIPKLPPRSLERGPLSLAPSLAHQWIPGNWQFDGADYAWKAGGWAVSDPNRVWTPPQFVLTERGVLAVDGYWDYPLTERGKLFAPVALNGSRARGFVSGTALVAVDLKSTFRHLFVRRGEAGLYFGDHYGAENRTAGWIPWAQGGADRLMFDPLLAHYKVRYARQGINLAQRLGQWAVLCDTHPELRPLAEVGSLTRALLSPRNGSPVTSLTTSLAGAASDRRVIDSFVQRKSTLRNVAPGGVTQPPVNLNGLANGRLGGSGLSREGLTSGNLNIGGLTGGLTSGGLSGGGLTGGLSGGLTGGGLTSGIGSAVGSLTSGGLSGGGLTSGVGSAVGGITGGLSGTVPGGLGNVINVPGLSLP